MGRVTTYAVSALAKLQATAKQLIYRKLATMLRMPALSRSALSMLDRPLSTNSGLVVILNSLVKSVVRRTSIVLMLLTLCQSMPWREPEPTQLLPISVHSLFQIGRFRRCGDPFVQ